MKPKPNWFSRWWVENINSAKVNRQLPVYLVLTITIIVAYSYVPIIFGEFEKPNIASEISVQNRTAETNSPNFCVSKKAESNLSSYSTSELQHCSASQAAVATKIKSTDSVSISLMNSGSDDNDLELLLEKLKLAFSVPIDKINADEIELLSFDLITTNPELAINLFNYPWHELNDPEEVILNLVARLDEIELALLSDAARQALNSPNSLERVAAIAFLKNTGQSDDPIVRSRLIELGWADQDNLVQLAVLDTLSTPSETDYSRDEQIMLLSEIAISGSSNDSRSLALFNLVELGFEGPAFEAIAIPFLFEDQPDMNSAAVSVIGATLASQNAKSTLLTLAETGQAAPSVMSNIIDVLQSFELTSGEIDRLNALIRMTEG